jgi:hypothetical protein
VSRRATAWAMGGRLAARSREGCAVVWAGDDGGCEAAEEGARGKETTWWRVGGRACKAQN